MKKLLLSFVLIAMSIMAIAQFQTAPEWTGISSNQPETFQKKLISSTENSVKVNVQVPGFYTTTVTTPNGPAKVVTMPKAVSTAQAGEPDVPMTGIPVMIGDHARMNVRVVDAKYMDFENIEVAPSKGDFPRSIDPETVPYTYGECYNQDAFFPAQNLGMYEPYIIRDFRGQNMAVYPFAYNPVTKTLRVYYDMTVEMYKVDDNGENVIETRRSNTVKMDQDFKSVYQRHFINFEEGMAKYTPLDEEGDLLIICYDNFISSMTDFVNWKKTRGINTTIVGTSTAGSTASAIKSYIQNQYNANNNITHVLLVGDVAQIPGNSFSYGSGSSGYSGKGDNAYGQIVGTDLYNDVFIGRFSATNATHVATQVQKVITYERDLTTSATWLKVGEGISRKEDASATQNEDDYEHMNNIRTDLLNYGYTPVYQRYSNLTGYDGSYTAISSDINSGVGIVNYTNHGFETGWGANPETSGYTYYTNSHVNALTNDNKLPFVWSVACLCGKYDYSSDCFAEAWMKATNNSTGNPTGAIGVLMSYISQPWDPPMYGQDECIDILVESYSSNIKHTWGGTSINGLFYMLDQYGSQNQGKGTYQSWILYGDPSMMLRTKTPQAMTVTHNGSIATTATSYSVTVNNGNGAVATITDASHNILGKATVSNGTANVSLSGTLTGGSQLTLCVFGYNKVTYLGTISVTNPNIPQYTVSANVNPTTAGTVEGAGSYYQNTTCTLTATANRGYVFNKWNDNNTANPRTITVTGNATYTANFTALQQPTVTYTQNQSHGTMSITPTDPYEGETVTLTATPSTGYIFDHWDVNTEGKGNVEVVNNQFTMPATPVTIEAVFTQKLDPETLTVNGTNTTTNSYVPIYGLYADYGCYSQFIIPSSDIQSIPVGSTISKLVFYGNKNSQDYFGSKAQVQIGKVSNSSFSSTTFVTSGLTTVTSSSTTTLSTNASGELEITFETPYTYQGGNLLICIGGYGTEYASTNWTGVEKTDNVAIYKNSDYSNSGTIPTGSGTAIKFAPKTTITYTPSSTPSIALVASSTTVFTGLTATLTAITYNVTGSPTITYSSSNTSVATVSGSGNTATVTAVASGTATITASMTYEGTTYTAQCAITVEDPSYCEPSFSDPSDDYIKQFVTTGGTTNISNTSTYETGGYSDYYSNQSASIYPGETLSCTVTPNTTNYSYGHAIWVDWNKDYEFASDERVAYSSSTASGNWTGSFTVPTNTAAGDYRMRVIHRYNNTPSADDACMSSSYGEAEDYKLTILSTVTHTITVNASPAAGGTVTGSGDYNEGSQATIEATANTGYGFTGWQLSGSVVSTDNPYSFTVTEDATYTAVFAELSQHSITVVQAAEGGSISADPTTAYAGDVITLTATPAENYFFAEWDVVDGSNNTITVTSNQFTMPDSDVTVTASFTQGFNVTLVQTENGTISADKTTALAPGEHVTLTATPDTDCIFMAWYAFKTGDPRSVVSVVANTTIIMPASDVTVQAIFVTEEQYEQTLGSGNNTSANIPTKTDINYSLTQQIYTASEIEYNGRITAIAFKANGNATRSLIVYMAHTDKTTFSSPYNWDMMTAQQQVFTGDVTFSSTEWTVITLDKAFEYNGESNLNICVIDKTASSSTSISFNTYSTSANRALYISGSDTEYSTKIGYSSINTSTYAGSYSTSNNQIKLTIKVPGSAESLKVSPGEMNDFTYRYGEGPSRTHKLDIVGVDLTDDVTITAPTNFEVCLTENGTYASSVTVPRETGSKSARSVTTWGFEGTMDGWTTLDDDGDGYDWVFGTECGGVYLESGSSFDEGHNSSSDMLVSGSWTDAEGKALTPDNWLISPQVELGGAFSMWAQAQHTSYTAEHFGIYVSTTGTNPSDFTVLDEWTLYDGLWRNYSVDLSLYTGQQGYIAVRHFNCTDIFVLGVDDFELDTDAAISIEMPVTITAQTVYVRMKTGLNVGDYSGTLTGSAGTGDNLNGSVSLSGTVANHEFTKHIAGYGTGNDKWYLIASPLTGETNPMNVTYLVNTAGYDLYYFDQSQKNEWVNYKAGEGNVNPGFNLVAGKGYLYANSETVDIVFSGIPYSGNGQVTLAYDDNAPHADIMGWNLIGNPFGTTAYLADDNAFYRMNDDGDGFITPGTGDSHAIAMMEGIFVQAGEDGEVVTFTTTAPGSKRVSSSVVLNVLGNNVNVIDRTIVRMDYGHTLQKLTLTNEDTKIYIPQDDADYAIVRAEGNGSMPINFRAKEMGSYTIVVETEGYYTNYLHLIDRLTGDDVNLLVNNKYTFIASNSDIENRFILSFGDNANNNFAYQSGNDIVVTGEGELQIFDVMGRMVKNTVINGVQTVNVKSQGVYILKLNEKTQKIIVR